MMRPADVAGIPAEVKDWSWRSSGYAWWVVIVLALSLTLSLVDRMILALMIEPIKRDLGLSDTQIGLVHGVAFTLLYIVVGLPLGRVADSWSRRGLAALSVAGWSVMTALCGTANSFGHLFAARMGVGVGEAGLSPAAISLVSDYFPKEKRARPLAFLTIGTTAGAGLALMFGGAVIEAVGEAERVVLPLAGAVFGWQAVFLLLGVFGGVFALIYLTVAEPERRESLAPAASVQEVASFIWKRRGFFLAHFLGASFAVMVLIGFHSWMPTAIIRRSGWDAAGVGFSYGLCIGLAGLTGILGAGWSAERMMRRGVADAHLLVAGWAAALAILPMAAAAIVPVPEAALALLFVGVTLLTVPSALAPVALQSICPNEMRGQVFAVYLFVLSLLGYAGGPLLVALITDQALGDEQRLYISLFVLAVIFTPVAAGCIAAARRRYRILEGAVRP